MFSFLSKKYKSFIAKIFFQYFFVLIIFAYSVYIRFDIPNIVINSYDEYQFLLLSIDTGHGLDSGMTLPFYQLIVLIFTKITNSFSGILIFQYFLSFVSVAILFLILRTILNNLIKNSNFYIKSIIYLLFCFIFFLITTSSQNIRFERSMRPEFMSIFFQLCFIYFYTFAVSRNKIKSWQVYLFIVVNLFSVIFQPKLIFLVVFNIIGAIWFLFKKDIVCKNKLLKLISIFVCFFILFFSTTTIIKRTEFHKGLYFSNIFWKSYKNIHRYVKEDIDNISFDKYEKNILIDMENIYSEKSMIFENGSIIIDDLDAITYIDGQKLLQKNSSVNMDKIMSHYYLKSLILSPDKYISDYIYQWITFISKQKIFYCFSFDLNDTVYISYANWLNGWYENREKPEYLARHIYEINTLPSTNFYRTNQYLLFITERYLNRFFYSIILLYLFICVITIKTKNILLKKYKQITNVLFFATFLFYSFTTFFFLATDRYVAEVFPLFIFLFFFAMSTIIISINELVIFFYKNTKK